MRMHDGMVMANKGFQDKLFKMYTGQSLKGVRCLWHIHMFRFICLNGTLFSIFLSIPLPCPSLPIGVLCRWAILVRIRHVFLCLSHNSPPAPTR